MPPTTLINGSVEPLIHIATKFFDHDPACINGSPTTLANGDSITPINGSTKAQVDIATVFLDHDPAYINGSTSILTNGSTNPQGNIDAKICHHDPDYTNGSANTPTDGSTSTPLDIASESPHHDPTFTPLDTTPTLVDITPELSHHDPTLTRLNATTSPLDIATEFSHHDPSFARLNNGSFGCCPSTILSAQKTWHRKFLSNPDLFYFDTLQPSLLKSRHVIKTLINSDDVDKISILDNVTTAAAVVLRSTAWSFFSGELTAGDSVLILQKAYGAVKKSVAAYVSRAGGNVIEVPLPFPVNSNEEIITEFRKALKFGKINGVQKIKLALIDHVMSFPSILIPVKELVEICRDEGVEKVFVDGAHGVGCVKVDVEEIGADFYASSLYKWFFCPPAAAFLYCKSRTESMELHHPIVSHEYGKGLPAESGWIGTRDYSSQCLIPEVLEFMTDNFEGGIDGILRRNHEKVVEMAEMLVEAWGTGLGAPPEMCASMVMVGLPSCLGISSDADGWDLMERLRNCFQILAPVYYREPLEGDVAGVITGYVRISHQVYNKVDDYFRLKDAIDKLVADGFTYNLQG